MLLPDNIHPEYSVYYNGAFVLQSLKKHSKLTLFDLYQEVIEIHDMTFPIFVLCLDWLYLLNIVKLNNDGEVELCS